jgi:hypothetical protein
MTWFLRLFLVILINAIGLVSWAMPKSTIDIVTIMFAPITFDLKYNLLQLLSQRKRTFVVNGVHIDISEYAKALRSSKTTFISFKPCWQLLFSILIISAPLLIISCSSREFQYMAKEYISTVSHEPVTYIKDTAIGDSTYIVDTSSIHLNSERTTHGKDEERR